ncbi:MAG: sugar transporter [Mucilaginibacter sp.]|nr:sugar transporter [Mucilaginibacter sp.]
MKLQLRYFFLLLLFVESSCISYKHVPYFQDMSQRSDILDDITNYKTIIIQNNDILSITVTSLNPEASAPFSPPVTNQQTNTAYNPLSSGYLVDQKGNVQLPYIGDVKVAGLTTSEAKDLIRSKLDDFLKEPVVRVYINNFKIGVFGGVNSPGIFQVNNERITLAEALIMAGDLKLTAPRNNILLVREIDGKRKFVRFDLNSKNTFNSPYFYLRNNDLIYIEPGTTIEKRENFFSNIGIVTSLISIISVILIFTRK